MLGLVVVPAYWPLARIPLISYVLHADSGRQADRQMHYLAIPDKTLLVWASV